MISPCPSHVRIQDITDLPLCGWVQKACSANVAPIDSRFSSPRVAWAGANTPCLSPASDETFGVKDGVLGVDVIG